MGDRGNMTSGLFRIKSTTFASGTVFMFVMATATPNTIFVSSLLTSVRTALRHVERESRVLGYGVDGDLLHSSQKQYWKGK